MNNSNEPQLWDDMWKNREEINENVFFKCVVDAVIENINVPLKNALILEAGAGTGTSSFQLAKRGSKVTLVDFSKPAIEKMERLFTRGGFEAKFLCNDIRKMDEKDDTYDVVFNSGVLEHFSYNDQVSILRELGRVCKPNGRIITMNPNAKCIFYRFWKWGLESMNSWEWGDETPVVSLESQFRAAGLQLITEYSIGFDHAVTLLNTFDGFKAPAHWFQIFYNSLSNADKKLMEGYLLCSVGKK